MEELTKQQKQFEESTEQLKDANKAITLMLEESKGKEKKSKTEIE